MSAESNRATVERLYERFNRNETEPLDDLVAPSLILHTTLLTDPKGDIGDLRQLFAMVRGGVPNARLSLEQVVADGDLVAVRFIFAGTHLGEVRGNEPTGREVSWEESMFFRLQDGRVHEMWHVLNVMDVLEQLGALPPEKVRERIAGVLNVFRTLGRLVRPGRR